MTSGDLVQFDSCSSNRSIKVVKVCTLALVSRALSRATRALATKSLATSGMAGNASSDRISSFNCPMLGRASSHR